MISSFVALFPDLVAGPIIRYKTLAAQLADHYDIHYHWQGDALHFERSGVSGHITLEPGKVRVNARLGFLLVPLKQRLEQEIHRYLDDTFQEPHPA